MRTSARVSTPFHALDFARKLYLIENCIYGVDIQPIATQIAKLRFFIALIVDQRVDPSALNLGVRPLPNLETKIVAADALIPIEKPDRQMDLLDVETRPLRRQLEKVRHDHFNTRTPSAKARCRQRDAELRAKIANLLKQNGMSADEAKALAAWDPYDQNHAAPFFDSEWMFGLPVGRVKLDSASRSTLRGNFAFINDTKCQMELPGSGEIESGFDVVLGNPPYVRIQTLKQQNPKLVEFYKARYESARKGNYDLYVVFVEAGLNFLKRDGHLAYILPHKFFNAQYGEPLRGLLAKGKHLQHLVHFGDQQVFPGASNYVCLLFLAKAGVHACRVVRSDDLAEWLRTFSGSEGNFADASIGASEWNFTVGKGANLFERLRIIPQTLGEVASIFVGLQTSADRIYVLEGQPETRSKTVKLKAKDGSQVEIERGILKPFLMDVSLQPYATPLGSHWLIFPYRLTDSKAHLLEAQTLINDYPLTWAYLMEHDQELKARDSGKWGHEQWYAFGRSQNLTEMDGAKLIVQVIAQSPRFAHDASELYFTGGGNGPYYGIRWLNADDQRSLHYLQALLNSRLTDYFMRQISTTFRGGYFSYGKRFIEQIPIASSTLAQQGQMVGLVDYLLWLNNYFQSQPDAMTARDALMMGWWEQVLNGLVYELYFVEELHAKGLHFFDLAKAADLPEVNSVPKSDRLPRLRADFERTYHINHPLRGALHALRSLETIRIIEGEK